MSRDRTFRIAALNITTHPHSPDSYAELFRGAVALGKHLKLRGDYYAKVNTCFRVGESDVEGLYGDVIKYFNLDATRDWFNLLENEAASDEDRKEIVIPDHLKPHLQLVRYVFFPKSHRLFFVTKSTEADLSPKQALSFFSALLNAPELPRKYVDVTLEQSPDALRRILNHPHLTFLSITVKRPNADVDPEYEADLMETMEEEGVIQKQVNLTPPRDGTITPNAETRRLAAVAVSNGEVQATVLNAEDRTVPLSTANHPRIEPVIYNPEEQAFNDAFLAAVREMASKIRNNEPEE